jgi:hypothetical protein
VGHREASTLMKKPPPPQRAWLLVKDKADGKGKRKAECLVDLHPLGWEVRYNVDGQMRRTQVFRTQDEMLLDVNNSEIAFKEKGWVERREEEGPKG